MPKAVLSPMHWVCSLLLLSSVFPTPCRAVPCRAGARAGRSPGPGPLCVGHLAQKPWPALLWGLPQCRRETPGSPGSPQQTPGQRRKPFPGWRFGSCLVERPRSAGTCPADGSPRPLRMQQRPRSPGFLAQHRARARDSPAASAGVSAGCRQPWETGSPGAPARPLSCTLFSGCMGLHHSLLSGGLTPSWGLSSTSIPASPAQAASDLPESNAGAGPGAQPPRLGRCLPTARPHWHQAGLFPRGA